MNLVKFVEAGFPESLYITWKESGLNLSTFCERNAALIQSVWRKYFSLRSVEWPRDDN